LLIGILVQVLYDPISSAKHNLGILRVRNGLAQARAKWEDSEIKDYAFEISGNALSICRPSAIVEVKNNVVVKVETKSTENTRAEILPVYRWADPDWGDEVFLCNYNHFTMTQILDLLEVTLQNNPSTIIQADFDPDYGFVSHLKYGLYVGYGLLRPRISNCCTDFSIKNFRPIAE
jgi:hypothetical protein